VSYFGTLFSGRGRRLKDPKIVGLGCFGLLVAGAILLLLASLLLPQIAHPFAITLWKHWPGLILLGLAVASAVMAAWRRPVIFIPLTIFFFILWVASGIFGEAWRYEAYLDETNIQNIQTEPETTGFRFLPLEVAETTASNKISDPTVTPGNADPLINGSQAKWIVPLEPNNFATKYTGKQPGDLIINTTADVTQDNTQFDPGYGLCCFNRGIGWNSVSKTFWADYSPRNYMTVLDGETVIVQPYLSYHLSWQGIIPLEVPQYDGILVFHSDETIEDLSPSEAASKYPGGRFFPEEMAEYFSHAYQYKDGIWNAWFAHQNMPDVPHLGSGSSNGGESDSNNASNKTKPNQFPFLIPTASGPEWYSAVEPYGTSKSAYMAYYVNATDGAVQTYKFEQPLVGPDRAETFVNNAFNQLKGTYFYEPRPVVKGGNLYWMLSASASGTPDVQFTALVDAYSEDVIKLKNQSEVERVVNGEDPRKVGEVVSSSGSGTDQPSSSGADSSTGSSSASSGESTISNAELAKELRKAADRLEKAGGR
jgi:hypothetical protein